MHRIKRKGPGARRAPGPCSPSPPSFFDDPDRVSRGVVVTPHRDGLVVDLGRAFAARTDHVRETRDIAVPAVPEGADGHALTRLDDLRPEPAAFHQDGLMSPVHHIEVMSGIDVEAEGFDERRLGVEDAPRRGIPLRSARADDQRE